MPIPATSFAVGATATAVLTYFGGDPIAFAIGAWITVAILAVVKI